MEGLYKDSLPHGVWTEYSDEQPFNFKTILTYQDGQLNGPYAMQLGVGTKVFTGTYSNNRKQGIWNHYAYDGSLLNFATYRNDTLDGPFKADRISGQYKNGQYDGEITFEPREGSYLKVTGHYKQGRRHGKWTYISHRHRIVLHFINDTANGPYYKYLLASERFSDTIVETGTYKNNLQDGPFTTYNYNHKNPDFRALESKNIAHFKNGKQLFPIKQYFPNDSLMAIYGYDPATHSNLHCKWDQSGKLTEYVLRKDFYDSGFTCRPDGQYAKTAFLNGKGLKNRYLKIYNDSGILWLSDSFYMKGKLAYFDHYQYQNGQTVNESHLVNGKRNGRWFDKSAHYDWVYQNNVPVSKKGNLVFLNFETAWLEFFTHMDDGDERDVQANITSRQEPLIYQFKQDFNKPLSRVEKYYLYADSNARKNLVRDILINDTLHLHGEVIFSVYVTCYGELSAQKLIKGLHPYYDLNILSRLMFNGPHPMMEPGWHTYVFRF